MTFAARLYGTEAAGSGKSNASGKRRRTIREEELHPIITTAALTEHALGMK